MTDTGQVPADGQPENTGGQPDQPGAPSPGAYAYADTTEAPVAGEEDDLLLMPGSQGAWSEAAASAKPAPAPARAPEPGPGPHGSGGRDSAPADPGTAGAPPDAQSAQAAAQQPPVPPPPAGQQPPAGPAQAVQDTPASPPAPRRPLHLGPPVPEQSGAVRSLADRGPAPAPPHSPQVPPARQPGPPTTGPEYFDVADAAHDGAAVPDGSTASAPADAPAAPGPQPGTAPPPGPVQPGAWNGQASQTPAAPGGADAATAPQPAAPETTPAAEPVVQPPAAEPAPAVESVPAGEAAPAAEPVPPAAPDSAKRSAVPEPAPATRTPAEERTAPAAEGRTPEEGGTEDAGGASGAAETSARTPAPGAPSAPEAQLAVAAVPGAGPQVMEAIAVASGDRGESASGSAEPGATAPAPVGASPAAEEASTASTEAAADAESDVTDTGGEADAAGTGGVEEADAAEPDAAAPAPGPAGSAPAPAPAPGYGKAEREALHRLMRERRDVRNGFRSDPIPHEVLLRVLEAAHTAPSVGHSQPWDFVVIRSEETRRTMHELAMRQREAYARSLPRARAKQFKELKVEAILDTPVNIVVTADPTRGGRHTLGRHTQPQMAPYSSALAVENLWLAARAEGLGVGWVSFFDEREMVRVLGLPEHLEVVAYLCLGYVDAFPDEPELVQAGWSKRRPLSWVVHEESYGRRALPGSEPHDLLAEALEGIRPLDAKALGEAWERQKRMTKPSGALGMLEIISAQLCGLARQCPPPVPEPAAVAVFAGDHGVHAQGVTAWPQEVTAQMVANFLDGGAVCNAFANQVGAEVCVVDVGVAADLPSTPGLLPRKVRPGTADFTTGPALAREEVLRAIEVGIETARDLVAAGNRALLTGEMGIANTTVSAALVSVFTGTDPAEVTGRGTGVNDETHARKVEVVRHGLELHRPDAADPIGVLCAVGGLEHAAMAGLILGGASLRTPVLLDGVSAGAAALVAHAIAPEALAACIAGHRSAEPGHVAALNKLGLRPLIDLDLRLGEGTGALLALPMVQSAARAMHEVATFDSAGVTEKG